MSQETEQETKPAPTPEASKEETKPKEENIQPPAFDETEWEKSYDKEKRRMEIEAYEIALYVQAGRGISPFQDIFSGLTNMKELSERTRLTPKLVIFNSILKLIAKRGGSEYQIFSDMVDEVEHRIISLEGKGREEAILAMQRKTDVSVQPIAMPTIQTQPEKPLEEQQKKKHFWSRS